MIYPRHALATCGALLIALLMLTTNASAQKYATIHSFGTGANDGLIPAAPLVAGSSGVLYGTTQGGDGTSYYGTIFSLTPPLAPGGAWSETILYTFASQTEGTFPWGLAVSDGPDGTVLYGTTEFGGNYSALPCQSSGCGTAYSLTPPSTAGGAWIKATIHTFLGGSDGAFPEGPLTVSHGPGGQIVIYGTTCQGGAATDPVCAGFGCGTVYSLTAPPSPDGAWTESVLYTFATNQTGTYPVAGVTLGKNGVLYGTTKQAGPGVCGSCGGTVFSLSPPTSPDGAWTKKILHTFQGVPDGEWPETPLSIDSSGVIYGTTDFGGDRRGCVNSCGTVFSLTPPSSPGGSWTEAILHTFPSNAPIDYGPTIVRGRNGVLYGTTDASGATGSPCGSNGCGTVFALMPPSNPGGRWTQHVLHSFAGPPVDGTDPRAGLALGANGVLYGTTLNGGTANEGTVFALKP